MRSSVMGGRIRGFWGYSVFYKPRKNRIYGNKLQFFVLQGDWMMENYKELETLISNAKTGDQKAIQALNEVMKTLEVLGNK